MADLDMSDVLDDPDFLTEFAVIRRTEAFNDKGRSVTDCERIDGIEGVITRTNPNEVQRSDDGATQGRSITIVTRFRLLAQESGCQPDQLEWNGALYTVKSCDPYTHFGTGFVQATAQIQAASVREAT